jgi:hypothetical protein
MRKSRGVFFVLAALCVSASARAQEGAPVTIAAPSGITVQGTGEVQVRPDIARLNLGVQTQNTDSQKASQENARLSDAIIKAVRALGVAERDVQTSGYSINPQFDYQPNRSPRLTGYQVSNMVLVTVRKIGDTGRVIDAAVKAGANLAGGINFDLNDADKAKAEEEAMTRAVTEADRKAKVIARAANIPTLMLASITENAGGYVRPMFREVAMARVADAAPTPVQPGEQTISASVTARYTFAVSPTRP